LFPKADQASYHNVFPVKNAAYAKRIVRLVFCVVWNLVVEWAKPVLPIAFRLFGMIGDWEAEHFRKGLFSHAGEGNESNVSGQAASSLYAR
jgi:hypothetical protein